MAEFTSKYSELGFYVDGSLRNFRGGRFVTDEKSEIEVLRGLADVEEAEPKPPAKAKTEAKPSGK